MRRFIGLNPVPTHTALRCRPLRSREKLRHDQPRFVQGAQDATLPLRSMLPRVLSDSIAGERFASSPLWRCACVAQRLRESPIVAMGPAADPQESMRMRASQDEETQGSPWASPATKLVPAFQSVTEQAGRVENLRNRGRCTIDRGAGSLGCRRLLHFEKRQSLGQLVQSHYILRRHGRILAKKIASGWPDPYRMHKKLQRTLRHQALTI